MVALLLVATALAGTGPVELSRAFPEGRTLVVTQTLTTEIQTPDGPQTTRIHTVREQEVLQGGRLGEAPLRWRERIARQTMDLDLLGQRFAFDSDVPGSGPPGMEVLQALVGMSYEVEVSPELQVAVGTVERDVARLEELPSRQRAELAAALDPEALAHTVREYLAQAPTRQARVGESWTAEVQTVVPNAVEPVTAMHTWTLDRVEDGKAWLSQTVSFEGEVRLQVGAATLDSIEGQGELVYDLVHGVPLSHRLDLRMQVSALGVAMETRVHNVATVVVR